MKSDGRSKLYFESYDLSYTSYAKAYCKATGARLIHLSERHTSFMKLPLWTGQSVFNWFKDNFHKVEPQCLIYTNSSSLAPVYTCMKEYLEFVPKIMIVINAEVEYPEFILPHSVSSILNDASNMLVADAVVFHTNFQKEQVLTRMTKYIQSDMMETIREKSVVLPMNGLMVDDLCIDKSKRDKKVRILWNHRLSVEKRPEIFLKALHILKDEGLDFEVSMLTEQASKRGLRESIEPLVESGHIIFHGFVKDRNSYKELMQGCHVVISTTAAETFSTSIVEAVTCGCIPMVPNNNCFPEMFETHEDAVLWLEDGFKAEDVANYLRKMIKGKISSKPSKVLSDYMQRYDKELSSEAHNKFIEQLISDVEHGIKSKWRDVETDATKKMGELIGQNGFISKRKLMNAMGWMKIDRWSIYSLRLVELGFEIEHTESDVFYKTPGLELRKEEDWDW